ncbi:LamG domain-containing protein [Streptomyces sp. NPDC002073]
MFVFQRWRLRHALASALGATLIVGVSPAYAPDAQAAESTAGRALTAEQRALQTASDTGEPVELISDRTEFTTTYANPDGQSFRLDQSVIPVRAKDENGAWVQPDASLEARADGTLGPKAAVVGLSFSNGGSSAKLATISQDQHSLALGWRGALPKPTVDGDSAVYAEVLPGVDLRMTATTEGFRQVLVVKTPEAAQNPDLKRIEFDLEADELRVSATKEGGMSAVDGNGKPVFHAPPAQMWDSSSESAVAAPPAAVKSAVMKGAAAPAMALVASDSEEVLPNAIAEVEPADGPDTGDKIAPVKVEVGSRSLTVIPDPALLTQSDPSAFPLYIDPPVSLDDGTERTLLRSDGYEDYAWGNGEDNLGQGVGKCGSWNGYPCGPGYVQRLYFEFSPKKLMGKEVLKARFRITEPWAFQCEARNVWLVRTEGNISSATTWANKPPYLDRMGDRWVSAGRGSLCDPNSPTAPIEFADNPDEKDENLTPTVQAFAKGAFSRLTLELRAEDEGDTSAWKRFRNDGMLSVDFIARPSKPSAVGLKASSGQVCNTSASSPAVSSDPQPTLVATTEIYPGGEYEADLRVAMFVEKQRSDGTWAPALLVSAGNPTFIDSPAPGYVGANKVLSAKFPVELSDGVLYRYRAWTRAFAYGVTRGSDPTPGCYFKVDRTASKPPVITFRSTYTECTSTTCEAGGKPGLAGTVEFSPAPGDTNTKYAYNLSTGTTWTQKTGNIASVSITPPVSGTMRLSVKGYDSLGREGAVNIVDFVVGEGPGPVGIWNFDEASGAALDTSTANTSLRNNATLGGGATRHDTGRRGEVLTPTPHGDQTLRTDGVDDYAATSGPVFDTRASFTVSAWVRPNNTTSTFAVVGQAANFMGSLYISHHAGGTWSVRMPTTDDTNANISDHVVYADNPAIPQVWTHLTATYSSSSNLLKFYVNGKLQGEDTVTAPVASTGPMTFGRNKYRGNWGDYLPGRVDEVKVWQDDLSTEAVMQESALADPVTGRRMVELAGQWDLGKLSSGAHADTSGYGRPLTPTAGTTISPTGALVLDGTTGSATAAGPLVDDTGSFTVTAEAFLDPAKLLGKPDGHRVQIVGQRTASGSSWGLWFEKSGEARIPDDEDPTKFKNVPVGRWHFGRLTADGTGTSVASEDLADLGSATQITGVYDAQRATSGDPAGTITLYVGNNRERDPLVFTATVGSGEFAVGKGFTGGKWGHFLPGAVGDVRVWSGAMRDAAQVQHDV